MAAGDTASSQSIDPPSGDVGASELRLHKLLVTRRAHRAASTWFAMDFHIDRWVRGA